MVSLAVSPRMVEQLLKFADLVSLPIFIALLMIGLFEGIRRLALGARTWSAVASTVICVSLFLGISALEFWIGSMRTPGILSTAPMPDVRPERYASVPPDQREKFSRSNAVFLFTNYGILVNHYDSDGQWRTLVPTQQEISDREALLHLDWSLWQTHSNAIVASVIALLAGVISAFLGWRAAQLQRRETANHAFNRTRRYGPST